MVARWLKACAIIGAPLVFCQEAHAQFVPNYFPDVPGFDRELGVTVISRLRPEYEQPGIHAGGFIIRPNLDESTGYNSNVLGLSNGRGSWLLDTAPSVTIASDWGRNRLGAELDLDNLTYFDTPRFGYTNYTVAVGGGYTIGRSDLNVGYAHRQLHESPTDIGALPSDSAIPYETDDFRINYTFDLGRLKITPNAEYTQYTFGRTSVAGMPASQSFRDRNVTEGGAEFRYELATQRNVVVVLQAVDSRFNHTLFGGPNLSSDSGLALVGLDYQWSGPLRTRVLVGGEVRSFQSPAFKTRAEPIAQADVIWTPTNLTTITGSALRTIEDPIQEDTSGFTFSRLLLRVDHEYARNIILDANGGFEAAQYFNGGGTTTAFFVGAGATWLINRNMRLSASYQYTNQNGSTNIAPNAGVNVNGLATGTFSQNLVLLTLHLGL